MLKRWNTWFQPLLRLLAGLLRINSTSIATDKTSAELRVQFLLDAYRRLEPAANRTKMTEAQTLPLSRLLRTFNF
jgi:hypothetical protein